MPVVYFIRHGETDWNAERRIQGQLDIPLNARGREQACRNGRVLAELITEPESHDFVASPLIRACETMSIILRELGLPPEGFRRDSRLMEIHYGDWQGHVVEALRIRWAEAAAARDRDPWNVAPPGRDAENYAMLSARITAWFSEILRDTVVVAHCGVSRALRAHVMGLDAYTMHKLDVPQDKILRIEGTCLTWY